MTKIQRQSGFSLVEVTLAIGIIGFALLAIFGLIPVGLKSSRDAVDDTKTSLMAQDIFNRVKSEVATDQLAMPWTNSSGKDTFQLRWNQTILPATGLCYSNVGNVVPAVYNTTPQPSTTVAYYDSSGLFVKQASQGPNDPVDPTRNFVRADIIIRPLYCDPGQVIPTTGNPPTYDASKTYYGEFVRPKATSSGTTDYAYLSVLVRLGWPTQPIADGALVSSATAAKKTYTFYLQKP
ncbi:MAG: hypothetical protein QOI04_1465 [Verrucomicrobiota bacterium]|jgi:uncharacterized protein (TIGR02598 family)